jgi:hypothetical protein
MSKAQNSKFLVIATLTVLLILLLTPRLIGSTVESATVDSLLDMIPPEAGAVLQISPTEFQRGWFTSSAQIDVRYDLLDELTGRPVSLLFDLDIKHGPLLFTSNGIRLGLAYADIVPVLTGLDLTEFVQDIDYSEIDLDFFMYAGFSDSIEIGFDLGELNASEENTSIQLAGASGDLTLMADQSSVLNMDSGAIAISDLNNGFDLSISAIDFNSTREDISQAISPGIANFSIPLLSSTGPFPITVNEITADYLLEYSDAGQNEMNISQLFSIVDLEWEIPLDSIKWSSEVNEINRAIFDQYFELIEQMQNPNTNNSGAASAQISNLGSDFLVILAGENFEFNNLLEANAYGGNHSLDLQVSWQGIPGLTGNYSINFADVFNALTVDLIVDADDLALSQSPIGPMVAEYKNQGLLSSTNGRVILNGSLKDGQLIINDESFPIDQFIAL